jgi:hypothetical protein
MLRKYSGAMALAFAVMVLFSAAFELSLQPVAEAARRFYVQSVSAGDSSVIVAGTSADPTVAVATGGITTDKLADGAVTPAKISGSFVNSVGAGDGSITVGGSASDPTIAVAASSLGNSHFANGALAQTKLAAPTAARVSGIPAPIGVVGWQDVSGMSLNFNSLGRPLTFACQASFGAAAAVTVDFRVVLDSVAQQVVRTSVASPTDFRTVSLSDVHLGPTAGPHTLKLQAMMLSPNVLLFTQPASCAVLEH